MVLQLLERRLDADNDFEGMTTRMKAKIRSKFKLQGWIMDELSKGKRKEHKAEPNGEATKG